HRDLPSFPTRRSSDLVSAVPHDTGSLARRMMLIAAGWITILLAVGGFALERTLATEVSRQFDEQLDYMMTAMIASAEIGPQGEVDRKSTRLDSSHSQI